LNIQQAIAKQTANRNAGYSGQTLAGVPVELLRNQVGNGGHALRQYNIDNAQGIFDKAGAQRKLDTDKAQFNAWNEYDGRLRKLGFKGTMDQSMFNTWLATKGNPNLVAAAEADGGMTQALMNSLVTANANKKKSNKFGIGLLKMGLGLAGGALMGGFGTLGGRINPAFAGSAQLPSSFISGAGSLAATGAQRAVNTIAKAGTTAGIISGAQDTFGRTSAPNPIAADNVLPGSAPNLVNSAAGTTTATNLVSPTTGTLKRPNGGDVFNASGNLTPYWRTG